MHGLVDIPHTQLSSQEERNIGVAELCSHSFVVLFQKKSLPTPLTYDGASSFSFSGGGKSENPVIRMWKTGLFSTTAG